MGDTIGYGIIGSGMMGGEHILDLNHIDGAAVVALAGRASDVNALVMLGLWVLWVVVGPALVTTAGAARFPTPEALELTVQQRHGYHGSWDRPVAETMAAFYARYPEWKDVPVPTDRYTNAWYYAMQQRGDDAAATAAAGYFETLRARHGWVTGWWPLLPPALVTDDHEIRRAPNEQISAIVHGKGLPHSLHVWNNSKHDWPDWRPMAQAYLP